MANQKKSTNPKSIKKGKSSKGSSVKKNTKQTSKKIKKSGATQGKKRAAKRSVKRNAKRRDKSWRIVLVCLVVALAGTLGGFYIYRADYFSHHFYKGTSINGIDCSDMTIEEAEAAIQQKMNGYALTIHERGGRTEMITAEQLQLRYLDDGKVHAQMEEQDSWRWFQRIKGNQALEQAVGFVYDVEGLSGLIDGLQCMRDYIAPVDASKVQAADGSWTIVPEVDGNQVNRDQVYTLIKEAIEEGKTEISLEESGCYLRPAVLSNDEKLQAEVSRLNQIHGLTQANITLNLGTGDIVETLGREVLTGWLMDDGAGNLSISREAIESWVQNLADRNGITGKKSFFRTTSGAILTLEKGDAVGWSLDIKKTADAIYRAVSEGFQGTVEPVYSRISSQSGEDVGRTYVEISISQQKMWCYQDGILKVETPVVTGDMTIAGRETPAGGIWSVKWKAHPYHMKGPKQEDGTYEYEVDVDFWMPFNDQVGIHDLSDRVEYGGDIYLTEGSHGCINTPYEAAKQIYEVVEKGTPVIVYE